MIPQNRIVPSEWFQKTPSPYEGAEKFKVALWWYVGAPLFLLIPHHLNKIRILLLRAFGAKIGVGCFVSRRAKIWMPWKLWVGDNTGIGFDALIYNFDEVKIGSYCSISPLVFINTASHDYRSQTFDYITKPVLIEDGCFIGADAYISPGVTIGELAVVGARSVVTKTLPSCMVCAGQPCIPIKSRFDASN